MVNSEDVRVAPFGEPFFVAVVVLFSFGHWYIMYMEECAMKGYLSIRETSYKWNVSERRVNQYVTEGRIPGVERFGKSWAIPEDAKKPTDPRKDRNRK